MTKSLLTPQDIKAFILEEIDKIDIRQKGYYRLTHIARKFGLSPYDLRRFNPRIKPAYIKGKVKYYNIEKVASFLHKHGVKINYQYDLEI